MLAPLIQRSIALSMSSFVVQMALATVCTVAHATAPATAVAEKLLHATQSAMKSEIKAKGVTLTISDSADPVLTHTYAAGPSASLLATAGGMPTAAGGYNNAQYLYFPVSSVAPATNGNLSDILKETPDRNAWGWSASFNSDSDRIEIQLGTCAACRFRVRVDGRYVASQSIPGIDYIAYVQLTFSGAHQAHTITVEGSGNNSLRRIAVRPKARIWRPRGGPYRIVALATGDSYSEGQGASSPGLFAWPQVLARLMGWSDMRQVAVGATGYLNPAFSLGRSKIAEQIGRWFLVNADLTPNDVDVVIVAAGYNDYVPIKGITYSPEQIATEALADWRAIRTLLPRAMIIVIGPYSGARGPDVRTHEIENALATRFAQWKPANALFIPTNGSKDGGPWIFGTGHSGATNRSGNSDVMISTDGIHPSDAGHALYAHRIAKEILRAIRTK